MGIESGNLDYWRNFFSNSNIFDVIEKGILIAASDRPTEFQRRRVRIAEMLFSCRTARCFNCNSVELQVPEHDYEDDKFRKEGEGIARDGGGCGKESKVNSSAGDDVGNNSYDEAEALTEEIEEENQIVAEVLRIKAVLSKQKNESNSVLFDSLRRLQLMRLSVETLQATEIGKAVNGLKKHDSKEIRHLVRTLIEEWKVLVDDWVAAAPVIEESTPESTGPSSFDEDTDEGLPSPPLDEGAFLPAGQTTSLEFSKFFDGMDDDGNLRTYGKFNKNKEMGRRPLQENPNEPKGYDPSFPSINPEDVVYARTDDFISRKEKWQWDAHENQSKSQVATINPPKRPQESLSRPLKSSVGDSGTCSTAPQKPSNLSKFFKSSNERKPDCQRLPAGVQKKHTSDLQDKSKNSDDNSVRAKLELAKRKLHERYQEAENAKKQRTIQVMELNDIPKKGSNRKQFLSKHGNFSQLPTSRWN